MLPVAREAVNVKAGSLVALSSPAPSFPELLALRNGGARAEGALMGIFPLTLPRWPASAGEELVVLHDDFARVEDLPNPQTHHERDQQKAYEKKQ